MIHLSICTYRKQFKINHSQKLNWPVVEVEPRRRDCRAWISRVVSSLTSSKDASARFRFERGIASLSLAPEVTIFTSH